MIYQLVPTASRQVLRQPIFLGRMQFRPQPAIDTKAPRFCQGRTRLQSPKDISEYFPLRLQVVAPGRTFKAVPIACLREEQFQLLRRSYEARPKHQFFLTICLSLEWLVSYQML